MQTIWPYLVWYRSALVKYENKQFSPVSAAQEQDNPNYWFLLSRASGDERWDIRFPDQSTIECVKDGLPIFPGS